MVWITNRDVKKLPQKLGFQPITMFTKKATKSYFDIFILKNISQNIKIKIVLKNQGDFLFQKGLKNNANIFNNNEFNFSLGNNPSRKRNKGP